MPRCQTIEEEIRIEEKRSYFFSSFLPLVILIVHCNLLYNFLPVILSLHKCRVNNKLGVYMWSKTYISKLMRFACQILPFYNNIRWLSWRILIDMKFGEKNPLLNILNTEFIVSTVCPWSSDQFYIVSNYIKWFTTSWSYSMSRNSCQFLYCEYTM